MWSGFPKAVYQKLVARAQLTDIVPAVRITEAASDQFDYPYIWLDRNMTQDWSDKTSQGLDAQVQVHIASTYAGNKELDAIADEVYAALNFQTITPEDAQCVLCIFQQATDTVDPDGVTRHRIMRFQLLISD